MSHHGTGDSLLSLKGIGKRFGNITALANVDLEVRAGEVSCVLGDNGAGKSTLIKIIAGLHRHDTGEYLVDGAPVGFSGPRQALDCGIATVYQDLAIVPLMSVWRNFFLGSELRTGALRSLDVRRMRMITDEQLRKMGIELPDIDLAMGNLSGGQRQVVAIARAVYFAARILVLDEPTAALGVKQSTAVLRYIAAAKESGIGIVLITHNPQHAFMVGDRFTVLKLGAVEINSSREQLTLDDLAYHMAGGSALDELRNELERTE